MTVGNKQNTKRNRFTTLSAFFNFIINTFDPGLQNPCEASIIKKMFKMKCLGNNERIFPITYGTARDMVRKAGKIVNVLLRPHDLRRFAATYASRSGTPIEIVSKVILRHANLSTTQRYLGKVSDIEAMRWIENLYG